MEKIGTFLTEKDAVPNPEKLQYHSTLLYYPGSLQSSQICETINWPEQITNPKSGPPYKSYNYTNKMVI